MCGIVGYVGKRSAAQILMQGLAQLEYRGYDSSGVGLLLGDQILIKKAEGRLSNVEKLLSEDQKKYQSATCGIGHTRWATHGKPTTQNAHPHKIEHIVLVHNGIIENYLAIKQKILALGHSPVSETDSELFGFLVLEETKKGSTFVEAVRKSFALLEGQCSVVIMSEKDPNVVIGVRNGSPLVACQDPEGGGIIASDAQPLMPFTRDVIFLEHGDMVVATMKGLQFIDLQTGKTIQREKTHLDWSLERMDQGGFAHYMLKEIYEQPSVLVDTLNVILDRAKTEPFSLAEHPGVKILDKATELVFVACGTSWHAALLGKYWMEKWAKIPVSVELASEFRYREPVIRDGAVVIGMSQSGETADTLGVLRTVKKRGVPTLGISNMRGSSIARESDAVFYTSAGPEVGVAATKTFTAQLLMMTLLAGYLGIKKNKTPELSQLFENLVKLPHILSLALHEDSWMVQQIQKTITTLKEVRGFFFIGRGYSYPIALEGALKLKEIAYDYAEGYAAGELKHGPIAMVDQGMVVVVLAPRDSWRDKTVSNLEEVKARGATIVGVGDSDDLDLRGLCDHWIPLPGENRAVEPALLPFLLTVVVQLLSYHRAVLKGTDVDKPRNLAKSVTVE